MESGSYAAAGVSIDAQDRTIELIRAAVRATYTPQVVTDVGSFGGMWALDLGLYRRPVLVSSVDSVGTKVMLAQLLGRHRGIGFDMVHHAVNDIGVMGADPAFFLDYYATGKLHPEAAAEVITGLADACRGVGCALVGGELAELPGMYHEGVYDLVGCIVGVVERDAVLDGRGVAAGDVILGLESSGLHTNGYSLARRALLGEGGPGLDSRVPGTDHSVGEALLEPHRCYLEALRLGRREGWLKSAAHITGGGVFDNLPRVLPAGLGAVIERGSWPEPAIFGLIADHGRVAGAEMFHTFNMGLGMLFVVAEENGAAARKRLADAGFAAHRVGRVSGEVVGVQVREPGRDVPLSR
ncbi:MAG: phosphoribosylformylglycinamidine cyclo-ligase [Armatimonadetes bacterium]|nr:phosphoribosylformylglycinamidine cyclo-ligase [Armatimonadota bacterium]